MPSIAPNALMKSPRMPPCPPTSAVRPAGGSATTSRMSATAAWICSPSEDAIGTTTWAATPSAEYAGCRRPRARVDVLRRPAARRRRRRSPACPRRSGRPGARRPRSSGSDSWPVNSRNSSSTLVDSALCGRNDALSFFCTSDSRPAKEPSGPPTKSQSSTTTSGSSQARRRPLEPCGRHPRAARRHCCRAPWADLPRAGVRGTGPGRSRFFPIDPAPDRRPPGDLHRAARARAA